MTPVDCKALLRISPLPEHAVVVTIRRQQRLHTAGRRSNALGLIANLRTTQRILSTRRLAAFIADDCNVLLSTFCLQFNFAMVVMLPT